MTIKKGTALEKLVAQSARGDSESFKVLFDLLHGRIFAYVRSRTGGHDEALDTTQQIFIELWKALPRFHYQSDAAFHGFLFTIARRQIIGTYRKRDTSTFSLRDAEEPVAEGENIEEEDEIMRALTVLDDITKEIIVLHHWSRYTFGEIGAMLGMMENAVRVRHHRGLVTLKATLTNKEI